MKRGFVIFMIFWVHNVQSQTPISHTYFQRLHPFEIVHQNDSNIFIAGYNSLAPQITSITKEGTTNYKTDLWGGDYGASSAFNMNQKGLAMFAGSMISIDTLIFNGDTFYTPVPSNKQYINHVNDEGGLGSGVIFSELFDKIIYVEETTSGYITAAVGDLIESIHIVHTNSSGKIRLRKIGPTALNAGKKPIKVSSDSNLISFGYNEAWEINKWTGTYETWVLNGLRAKYDVLYFTNILRARGNRMLVVGSYRVHNDSVSNTMLAEITPNGNIIRDTVFANPKQDSWISDIIYDTDSNLLLAGYTRDGRGVLNSNALIWKMDSSWNNFWQEEFTGPRMNSVSSIKAVNDSQFVACGYYDYYSLDNMQNPQADANSSSFYLAIDSSGKELSSIPSLPKKTEIEMIYPNPTTGQFRVSRLVDFVEVYSVSGVKLIESTASSIDIQTLVNGIYFVKLSNSEGFEIRKLMKSE